MNWKQKMDNQLYSVCFNGKIADGAHIDTVKNKFASFLRLKEKDIEKLFSGREIIIKRNVSYEQGGKIQAKLRNTGAVCQIKAQQARIPNNIVNSKPKPLPIVSATNGRNIPHAINKQVQPVAKPQIKSQKKNPNSILSVFLGIFLGTPIVFIIGIILQNLIKITIGIPLALIFISWWISDVAVRSRAKHFVPAFSFIAGAALWLLIGSLLTVSIFGLVNFLLLATGLVWLLKRPSLGPVIYLIIIHLFHFLLIVISSEFLGSAVATHVMLKGISMYLLYDGYRKIKNNQTVLNKTTIQKLKEVIFKPKNIISTILIIIFIKAIAETITKSVP